jgi:hypothetical protein
MSLIEVVGIQKIHVLCIGSGNGILETISKNIEEGQIIPHVITETNGI